jgi:hypothetical protein
MSRPINRPDIATPLSVETIEKRGVNAAGELFWDGKPVEVRKTLLLSPLQRAGAAIVVAASVAGGVGGLAQGITAAVDFGCARGMWRHFCPLPAKADHGAATSHAP